MYRTTIEECACDLGWPSISMEVRKCPLEYRKSLNLRLSDIQFSKLCRHRQKFLEYNTGFFSGDLDLYESEGRKQVEVDNGLDVIQAVVSRCC